MRPVLSVLIIEVSLLSGWSDSECRPDCPGQNNVLYIYTSHILLDQ